MKGAAEAQLPLELGSFPQEAADPSEVDVRRLAAIRASLLLLHRLDSLPPLTLSPVYDDLYVLVGHEESPERPPQIKWVSCQDHLASNSIRSGLCVRWRAVN
ncbi:MAG: hypothetical protein ACHQ7N_16690 [Candidatus Methylomirabilales bacterium]